MEWVELKGEPLARERASKTDENDSLLAYTPRTLLLQLLGLGHRRDKALLSELGRTHLTPSLITTVICLRLRPTATRPTRPGDIADREHLSSAPRLELAGRQGQGPPHAARALRGAGALRADRPHARDECAAPRAHLHPVRALPPPPACPFQSGEPFGTPRTVRVWTRDDISMEGSIGGAPIEC